MSRPKTNWKEIFGTDADLLRYCRQRGLVNPTLDIFIDFLNEFQTTPDHAWPEHRPHLSNAEWKLLVNLLNWRFGYKTFEQDLPNLSYWCEKLHFSRKHGIQMYAYLARQGLLRVWTSCKRGLALHFSIDVLLDRVRAWLGIAVAAAPQPAAEEVQPAPAVEPWAESQPAAAPEPELLPVAAMARAPEWTAALEQIQTKVPHAIYNTWFRGTTAYKQEDKFIICAKTTYGKERLKHSYGELVLSILSKLIAPSYEVFIDVRSG